MTRRACAAALLLQLACPLGAVADPLTPATGPELAQLTQRVADAPDDVDARMALAAHLSWIDHRTDARREALEVVRRAPDYADAYELLARLAGWDHDYATARRWLAELTHRHPLETAQLLLQADIELWDGQPESARAVLAAMPHRDMEVLRRLASIEDAESHGWQLHRLAAEMLDLEPDDPQARALYDESRRVTVGVESYLARYPLTDPSQRLAEGVIANAALFLRAHVSLSAQYEYDHRFGTDNHRLAARVDWMPSKRIEATVFARTGWVEVVPLVTLYAGLQWDPRAGTYLGARYTVDLMQWPGQLHRLTVSGGAPLPHHLRADASFSAGALDYCGRWSTVIAVDATASYVRPRWQVGLKYAHGTELDRPVLPAYLAGMYGANVCPADLGAQADQLALQAITADDFGVLATFQLDRRSSLGASYTYERRVGGLGVHIVDLGLTRRF